MNVYDEKKTHQTRHYDGYYHVFARNHPLDWAYRQLSKHTKVQNELHSMFQHHRMCTFFCCCYHIIKYQFNQLFVFFLVRYKQKLINRNTHRFMKNKSVKLIWWLLAYFYTMSISIFNETSFSFRFIEMKLLFLSAWHTLYFCDITNEWIKY